jgi:hypothetical protein
VGAALDQLAERIEQWKIEFEKFLAGALQLPPDATKALIVHDLRELRSSPARSPADQFRFSALEARFNSYGELNNRRLREREEGRTARHAPAAPRALDPVEGIVVTDRLEADAIGSLYDALSRTQSGAPAMALDQFRTYLSRQIEAIRLKTGCEAVQFRLASEDGKLKLKAKPVGT